MSNEKQETAADIVKEMRQAEATWHRSEIAQLPTQYLKEWSDRIEAAAKPVRNCDKYRTAEEANVAFAEFCGKNECRSCRCGDRKKNAGCVFEWLYEKADREVSK